MARGDLALSSVQIPYRDPADGDWLVSHGVLDLSPRLADLRDTAAILKSVNALVTVDTGVAHLAGGLGIPTIVMLRFGADWRWHDHAATISPWYDRMVLVRQTTPNDWSDVIRRVSDTLNQPLFA